MKYYHDPLDIPRFLSILFEKTPKTLTEVLFCIALIHHHDVRGFRSTAKVYSDKHYQKIDDQHPHCSSVNAPTIAEHEYYARGWFIGFIAGFIFKNLTVVRYLTAARDIRHCEVEVKSGFLAAASAIWSLTKPRCHTHLAPISPPQRGLPPSRTVSSHFTKQLSSAKWMLAQNVIRKCILHIKKARIHEPFSGVLNNQLFNFKNRTLTLANNVRRAIFCT